METTTDNTANNNSLDTARYAHVLVGNRKAILDVLNREIPLQDPKTADQTKRYFYASNNFESQIERVMSYNKTAQNKYVYAVIPYNEYVPEAEMTEELKNVPEQYRSLRFVRAEIHR